MLTTKIDRLGGPSEHPHTAFLHGNEPLHPLGLPNYWINTATLNLIVEDRIYAYFGLGPAVELVLTYNASSPVRGMFGKGWMFSYESSIQEKGGQVFLRRGSGQVLRFRRGSAPGTENAPVEAAPASGSFDRLLDYGSHWLYLPRHTHLLLRYDKKQGEQGCPLTSIADFDGNEVRFRYNGNGTLDTIVDAAGRETSLSCNGDGLVTEMRLADGRTARFTYGTNHTLARATDFQGIASSYTCDGDGRMVRMVVGEDRKTTAFSYSGGTGRAQISTVTDAAGNVTRYRMDAPGQVSVTDPEGNTTAYHSKDGRTERIVDAAGGTRVFEFEHGLLVKFHDANGNVSRRGYDERGNCTRLEDAEGGVDAYTFDAYDNLLTETNALGERVSFAYDPRHHLISVTTPLQRVSRMAYDERGQRISVTNAAGGITRYEYDRFGNVASIIDALGNRTCFEYDDHGFVLRSVIDPDGHQTRYEYDRNDRIVAVHAPDGATRTHTYGCCAGLSTTDEMGRKTTLVRSPLLSMLQRTDPAGSTTRFSYDRSNRLVGVTDPIGRIVRYGYDPAGRLAEAETPAGGKRMLQYDRSGTITALVDEQGRRTTFSYDRNGRRLGVTDPANRTVTLTRDAVGRITSVRNARGEVTGYRYDADDNLVEASCNGVRVASFTCDAVGDTTRVTDDQGTTDFEYDADRRVSAIRYPDDTAVRYARDAAGNVTSLSYPGSMVVESAYDACGRVERISWDAHSITFAYDRAGNLVREVRSNGTESVYTYDGGGRLTGITHRRKGEAFIEIRYTRDAAGNVIEEERYAPETGEGGSPAPLLPSFSAAYTENNQIRIWNGGTIRYDADGNLVEMGGAGSFSARYDAANRPVEITCDDRTVSYAYDGLGRRTRAVRSGRAVTSHHGGDGRLLFETDGESGGVRSYLYGDGRLVAMVTLAGETRFYHFDQTGTTLALTDEQGEIAATYAYDAFGQVTARSISPGENPFTFVGAYGVRDEGEGIFFMKRRAYHAGTGTFLQKDPLGHDGGWNLYTYAAGNPVNAIDPEGTVPVFVLALLGAVALAGTFAALYNTTKVKLGNNPIQRALQAAATTGDSKKIQQAIGPNPKQEFFQGMEDVGKQAADGMLTHNPVTAPAWSAVKGVKSTVDGKPVDAVLNFSGAHPGIKIRTGPGQSLGEVSKYTEIPVGPIATALGETKNACDPPPAK
jgi:RHS repeat-associated protein